MSGGSVHLSSSSGRIVVGAARASRPTAWAAAARVGRSAPPQRLTGIRGAGGGHGASGGTCQGASEHPPGSATGHATEPDFVPDDSDPCSVEPVWAYGGGTYYYSSSNLECCGGGLVTLNATAGVEVDGELSADGQLRAGNAARRRRARRRRTTSCRPTPPPPPPKKELPCCNQPRYGTSQCLETAARPAARCSS